MADQKTSKRRRKARDLTEREIDRVFDDLHLPPDRRGLQTEDIEQASPMLLFPITVTTSVEPTIDW